MSLRGTVAVAAYSLAGGLFRYTAEEPLSQFWWSLTCMRIGCTLALERVLAAFPLARGAAPPGQEAAHAAADSTGVKKKRKSKSRTI